MFNSINRNPFQKVESAISAGQDQKQNQQQQEEKEKRHLDSDDKDEVQFKKLPELSEDDVEYLVKEYIDQLKSEHSEDEKIIAKLDKYMAKFDLKKFMKQNPAMTRSDFCMIMYNETSDFIQ